RQQAELTESWISPRGYAGVPSSGRASPLAEIRVEEVGPAGAPGEVEVAIEGRGIAEGREVDGQPRGRRHPRTCVALGDDRPVAGLDRALDLDARAPHVAAGAGDPEVAGEVAEIDVEAVEEPEAAAPGGVEREF